MKKLWLPEWFEKYNRVRGNGEKTYGLAMMALAWVGYMALAHDWYSRTWYVSLLHFVIVAVSIKVGILAMFKWNWGSKYWDNDFDTSKEKGFSLAESYASIFAEPNTSEWRNYAFDYVKRFNFTLGFSVIGLATLNPVIAYIGWRYGRQIADIYQEEFASETFATGMDENVLKRSEHRTGYLAGQMALWACWAYLVQNIVVIVLLNHQFAF